MTILEVCRSADAIIRDSLPAYAFGAAFETSVANGLAREANSPATRASTLSSFGPAGRQSPWSTFLLGGGEQSPHHARAGFNEPLAAFPFPVSIQVGLAEFHEFHAHLLPL